MGDVKAVELRAELRQVKSMADSTYNVTLNIPEDCIEQVRVMMGWIGLEVGVVIAIGLDGTKSERRGEK